MKKNCQTSAQIHCTSYIGSVKNLPLVSNNDDVDVNCTNEHVTQSSLLVDSTYIFSTAIKQVSCTLKILFF